MRKIFIIIMLGVALVCNAESLTLQQCLEKAKANNRELRNAAIDILSATEQQKEAFTKYFPQVSANVMAFRAFDDMLKVDGNYPNELAVLASLGQFNPAFSQLASYAGQPYSVNMLNRGYGATVTAMEPLYAGGKIATANKLAAVQKDCCELQRTLKEKDVLQKVTENFWHIATLKYNLRTIAAAEKQIAEVHRNVTNYVNAGVTTRNALLKVKLRQQELASDRLKLENREHILLMLLAQQIGAPDTDFDIQVPEEGDVLYTEGKASKAGAAAIPQQTPLENADNREELKLAEKNVAAQQLQIRMERSKKLPTLAVGVMGYNTGFGPVEDLNVRNNLTNGMALVTLSIPISEWWSSNHATRRAKFKAQQAQNDYFDTQEKLRIDNVVAWCNVTEAYKQIGIAQVSVEESEENLRMSMDRYKAGTETITDLLDAETLNRKSHDQLSSAIADYNIRLADYNRKTK